MNMSFYTGAAGAGQFTKKLSVVSNNLANINNTGFKPKTAAFSELIHYNLNDSENAQTELQTGAGTRGERTWTDFGVAGATQTGQEYDYAIMEPNAFFMLQDPATGEITYTRNGHFHRGEREDGFYLTTEDGKLVLDHPLTAADLGEGKKQTPGSKELLAGAELLHHPSAGNTYLYLYYDLGGMAPEDMSCLHLLTDVMDELDTEKHTAQELNTLRNTWLGSSGAWMDCWTGRQEGRPCHAKLIVGMSMLERSLEKAVELGSEWLYETKFSGPQAEAAMERVASQQKLLMEQKFLREGHAFAAMRAAAHFSVESALSERCNGVSYYHYLCELLEKADWTALGKKMEELWKNVLKKNALTVSLHGSDAALDTLKKLLPGSAFAAEKRGEAKPYTEELTAPVNEAFIIDGGVNYDVLVWPMERRLERKVLARVMSYEYLWHNIREVGGAYGTGMVTQNDDTEYLYTYRDPHLKESYETFAKGPTELAGRDYTEKDMNEFIVGAAAKLDTPRKPREEAASTDCKYFCGITDEMTAAERKSLCSVDAAALKAEAADLSARMEKGVRVVFGSKEAVEAAKELFDRVETL